MNDIKSTPYFSYKIGNLPKGCQLCVKGQKLVLFVTGLCPRCCYFCPISDKKYKKDVTYADEWPATNIHQIIKEAILIDAKGAGFTGGDPLCKLWRTLFCLRKLKKQFGKKFHTHLYTSLDLINKAGLDEIRFHLDLDNNKLWNKIKLAKKYNWKVGVEIPVIPKKEKQTKKLIDFLSKIKIDFLNLNELEIADNKVNKLTELGYKTKNTLSYAVKGSEESALILLKYCKGKIKNVHYCTATLKDRIQLANRIKRRAKNIAKPFDIINKEGTLTRGVIYLADLMPSFKYKSRLEGFNKKIKNDYLKKLKIIKNQLKKDFKIKNNLIEVDKQKLRILTSVKIINKIKDEIEKNFIKNIFTDKKLLKSKDLCLAIVEEYPTYDQIELNVEFL